MLPKRFGNLERAAGRFLRAVTKDQCHAITGRKPNQLFISRRAHLRCPEYDLGKLVQPLALFFDEKFRITDNVDEQHMPNLQAQIVVGFPRHHLFSNLSGAA